MNIDLSSICFNSSLDAGGGTPSWGTALGQSSPDYKLTYPGSNEILVAMNYKYVPLSNSISCKLGKGGHEYKALESQSAGNKYEIVMASLFDKTFIKFNSEKIPVNKPFGLLIIKENESVHAGRKSLKYSDSIVIGKFKNKDFFDEVFRILGGSNTCWFAYAINVENQDELIFSVVKVSNEKEQYSDSETRKRTWLELIPKNEAYTTTALAKEDLAQPLPPFTPIQIIYYGVPGCGKSFEVNKNIDDKLTEHGVTDKDYHKVRCVFHPEYSNADFVGQIYPYVLPDNKGVEYRFKPGPFAEVVRRAYLNPDKPYFLIIEEINRGNAAAIFGEMFQLLDRIEPGDNPDESTENTYHKGWSSYGVENIDVNAYIRQNKTSVADTITYAASVPYDNQVSFKPNTAIRLPPNLSVYATMNTSDQNVFTMDNAFQRRFKSKMIRNSLDDATQFNLKIGDTGVRWGDYRDWINAKILAPETGLNNAEDKCLGGWFIKGEKKMDPDGNILNECKEFPKDDFAEKVLKYLWNDVFKRNAAEKVFLKDKVTSLTNLIELFESSEKFAAFENIFVINEADKAKLLPPKNNP